MEVEFTLYKGKVKGKFLGPTPENPNRHMYYIDGRRPRGVTTYIGIVDKSRALVTWATELYRDFLLEIKGPVMEEHIYTGCTLHAVRKQQASDLGKEIHEWCEKYIKSKLGQGELPDMPEGKEAQIGVSSFLDWEKEHKAEFVSSERVVYSREHDYIGTLDIEAIVDGKLCLVDLKTSNGLYNTVRLQTAAYVMADQEESGRKYKGRWALRVSKETEREYDARMAKKNKTRERSGGRATERAPYAVFEAKFLDGEAGHMQRDFDAFINAKKLYEWNEATDFYQESRKAA